MDMLAKATQAAATTWQVLMATYPALALVDAPRVVFDRRLTRVAGMANHQKNRIELSHALFTEFPDEFAKVIIPHELAHIADVWLCDWQAPAWSDHGPSWGAVMGSLGLPADEFHNLLQLRAARKL